MSRAREDSDRGNIVKLFFVRIFEQFHEEIAIVVVGTIAALVRAAGVTIQSGQTGLLFSFGRAKRLLHPGFHLLIPFLQSARRVPTRSRTIDLPAQRVVTFRGLVYHVDANLVYRIVDVHKALIQIDDLQKGMRQMLGLGVQHVVRSSDRSDLAQAGLLDESLSADLATRLEPWGVQVERAGMTSVTPSRQTLRITQIERVVGERRAMLAHLQSTGLDRRGALGLMGTRVLPVRRHVHLRSLALRHRRLRRLRTMLMHRGWMPIQIKRAGLALRTRATTGGRLKTSDEKRSKAAPKPGQSRAVAR